VSRARTRLLGALTIACLVGCATLSTAEEAKQLRIVKQPGLGYLQLIVMRKQKLLEKRLPGVEIEWPQLTSGSVRWGMSAAH
jgi:NitT/TauT family transport system substrate-binding protein